MSSKVYADIYATEGPFTQFPGAGLPDIKRFITTHNSQGEGVFLPADNGDHQALMANGRGCQNILYTTQGEAVDLNGEVDIALAKNNAVSFLESISPGENFTEYSFSARSSRSWWYTRAHD